MQLPDDLVVRLAPVMSDVEATVGVDLSFRDEPYSHRTLPLGATVDSGKARWTCPSDATTSFAIGSLS